MDHPNIAKIFDAGTTERGAGFQPAVSPISNRQRHENASAPQSAHAPQAGSPAIQQTGSLRYELYAGRPYFVMELVRGIKITDYCDPNQLPTEDRLRLFIQVCQAIQHAHQKGIIHRDIKPSNILVTLNDGVAVPKVIDFGIAKATEERLTDKSLFTRFEALIGTPAYMSPEQALMTSLDIDTRSDIYSLGVLLYELLAGSTPFDGKELMASGIDAMRQTIREKEPLRPNTRLTQLRQQLASKSEIRNQNSEIETDLDWIVMKCLEKDRTRRYETANGLVADLKRHLNYEPVVARPPSKAYRLQKTFRRNKLVFAAPRDGSQPRDCLCLVRRSMFRGFAVEFCRYCRNHRETPGAELLLSSRHLDDQKGNRKTPQTDGGEGMKPLYGMGGPSYTRPRLK